MRVARPLVLVVALVVGAGVAVTPSAPTAAATAEAARGSASTPGSESTRSESTRSESTGSESTGPESILALPTAPAARLRDTGLYVDGSSDQVHPDNLEFSPQYPLWSDGAAKRRWLNLPLGTYIDATRPDAWEFPPGTRLWKEFSLDGRRIETRLIQRRADKSWMFVSYVWNSDGSDAVLAPARGLVTQSAGAPDGRYVVPSREDCLACHEGAAVPVLGLSAVQLARDRERDPGVTTDLTRLDLQSLVARGMLRNLPPSWTAGPPRIAAVSPIERAALGYLHGNCGHCHNHNGAPAAVRLVLAQTAVSPEESRERVLGSAVDKRSRFRPPGKSGEALVIASGRPQDSVLEWRMQSSHPLHRMPPLGTSLPDTEAIALIQRWIATDLQPPKEPLR